MNTLNVEGIIKLLGNELCIFIMLTCELILLFYPCAMTIVITRWLLAGCRLPVSLTKLLVETQLTCGSNKTPGRNKVVWSFTCEPNEAPGGNQIGLLLVGLMKNLVETKLWGLLPVGLTKLLVETKLCGLLPVGLTKLLVKPNCMVFYL